VRWSAWHEDATVDAGVFKGSAQEFCAAITQYNAGLKHTFHVISNELYKSRRERGTRTVLHEVLLEPLGGRRGDRQDYRRQIPRSV
jgi:hypothetical protein